MNNITLHSYTHITYAHVLYLTDGAVEKQMKKLHLSEAKAGEEVVDESRLASEGEIISILLGS